MLAYPRPDVDPFVLLERFWSKVKPAEAMECWVWLATHDSKGYGSFSVHGKSRRAHRLTYEALRTEIPPGLLLDHLCRVRACVNPWHLEPVTSAVNTARGETGEYWAGKTHCPKGHEYTPENTKLDRQGPNGKWPKRSCRTCIREYDYRKRRHESA